MTLYGAVLPPDEVEAAQEIETARPSASERQGRALEYLRTYGQVTRSEYCRICGLERSQAHRELTDLLAKGLIVRIGTGRGTRYVLAS